MASWHNLQIIVSTSFKPCIQPVARGPHSNHEAFGNVTPQLHDLRAFNAFAKSPTETVLDEANVLRIGAARYWTSNLKFRLGIYQYIIIKSMKRL